MTAAPSSHPAAAYPTWLPVPKIPVTVVVGPPGNRARDWIDAHRFGPDDIVIDLTAIIEELSGAPAHRDDGTWVVPALQARNARLAALGRDPGCARAWLIALAPKAAQREHWARHLAAEIVLRDPGLEAALIGARDEGIQERWVHRWYADAGATATSAPVAARVARPRATASEVPASNRGYGRNNHGKARDAQLAREPWCRFCWEERHVKVRATVLDHIKAFRRPDGTADGKLWGDPKNHRSLCGPCHDARGATRSRAEKPPGAGVDGRPLDPNHPWANRSIP